MSQILDITLRLGPETPLYPGDPAPEIDLLSDIANGDALTASLLHLPVHAGTHVDFPGHFIKGGRLLGDYSINQFIGPAWVADLTDVEGAIAAERLASEHIPVGKHILLKTRNSLLLKDPRFHEDYVYLEPSGVEHLLAMNPPSLGFDYYSLDPSNSRDFPAHRRCAEAGIPVFVCLDLSMADAGAYQFCGLPPSIPSLEGAPVRAILWRD